MCAPRSEVDTRASLPRRNKDGESERTSEGEREREREREKPRGLRYRRKVGRRRTGRGSESAEPGGTTEREKQPEEKGWKRRRRGKLDSTAREYAI